MWKQAKIKVAALWLVTNVVTNCDKMNILMSPSLFDVVIIQKNVHVTRKFYRSKVKYYRYMGRKIRTVFTVY